MISLYLCAVLASVHSFFSIRIYLPNKTLNFYYGFSTDSESDLFVNSIKCTTFSRKLNKSLWYVFNQLVDGKMLSSHWIIPSNRKCLSIFLTNQCERKVTEHQNLCLTPTWWDYISLDSAFKIAQILVKLRLLTAQCYWGVFNLQYFKNNFHIKTAMSFVLYNKI